MGRKNLIVIFLIIPFLLSFCSSGPEQQAQPGVEPVQEAAEEQMFFHLPQSEVPDEIRITEVIITQEYHNSTRTEVQHFIESLNQIIRNGNFQAWRSALSPEYYSEISSPENLRQVSEQPAMRMRNIVLRNANDYFTHVVVPSRAGVSEIPIGNIDIEFLSLNRVKAFAVTTTRTGEDQEVRLYDLEKTNDSWYIIN